jgi:hypothetical protein
LIELYRTCHAKYNNLTFNETINILVDIYNNTVHSATNAKPRDVVFNRRRTTNTEEIFENYSKLHSAIKVLMEKKKAKVQTNNETKKLPQELGLDQKVYIKNSQRLTKDREPYKIVKVQENQDLTFADHNGIKIHKNRIKS